MTMRRGPFKKIFTFSNGSNAVVGLSQSTPKLGDRDACRALRSKGDTVFL